MEVLGNARASLRSFLLGAATTCANATSFATAIRNVQSPALKQLLHGTVVYHYYKSAPLYPKHGWSILRSLQLNEVLMLVIERLLTRRRVDSNDSNLLTLGYREVAPGSNGHRVTASNSVMCYFPNTLVASLKTAVWEALHAVIGDDVLVHLLMNYCIFVKVPQPSGSYVQVAGTSLRWMKRPVQGIIIGTDDAQQAKKRRKSSDDQGQDTGQPINSTISINHVMYARHFQKRKLFAKSELGSASCCRGEGVSRGAATKLIGSMIPDVNNEKRLPKRLVNLVPIVQELLQRLQTTDVDALISKLLPIPPELRSFLQDHRHVRDILFATKECGVNAARNASSGINQALDPLITRITEEGYQSQPTSPTSRENRKRKRRELAVAALSSCSETVSIQKKKVRFEQEQVGNLNDAEPQLDVGQLAQLQRHRDEIAHLLPITVSTRRVLRVLRKVLTVIVPKSLFGKPSNDPRRQDSNWSKMMRLIGRLVLSRKYDVLSVDRVSAELRVKDIEWMDASGKSTCPPNELKARQILMCKILSWVIHNIVFPLLRNCFYITESEGSANEVFYYSRPVWTIISKLALYDLTSFLIKPITPGLTPLGLGQLGTSRLRLLPKINGVRPLMNLSGKTPNMTVSVNRSLELVHRALLFEIDRQSDRLLGATVRNVDEIHAKLKKLISDMRECPNCAHTDDHKLYCVTVDVERCFDTIRPKKLLRMLKKVFAEEEYLVRKHWVCKGAYYKMERPAYPSGDLKGYDQIVQDTGKKRDAVFVDGVLYDYITKAKILTLLREHLTGNTVQVNDQLYSQRHGIPQGSVLSTTLCNLYYANFEKRVLRKQMEAVGTKVGACNHELLMRYTDDFLFVSTDLDKARSFAELMHRGNQDYGCFVNPKKSRVNFSAHAVGADGMMWEIPRFDKPSSCDATDLDSTSLLLPWCGLLFDPTTLQMYANYDRLSLSVVSASIPMDETKTICAVFVNKVISAIRQRWHRLYFDPDLLLPVTIQVNVYQMMCLAAMRFVWLVDKLRTSSSVGFLHVCIHKIIMKTVRGVQRTLMGGNQFRMKELSAMIQKVGFSSFSAMIDRMKVRSHSSGNSENSHRQVTASSTMWEMLAKMIDQDRTRLETSDASATNTRSRLLTLSQLERDPRNAIVHRWVADYMEKTPVTH